MLFLNKLLKGIKNYPTIFKDPRINFILGLTNSQVKELKRFAITNGFIIQKKQEFFLTEKGDLFLKNNPFESWQNSKFPKRPQLNLEYLKEEKTTPTVTKAIRNLARHLLDGEELKPYTMEAFIQEELLSENSKFKELTQELNASLSENHRINLSQIYQKFISYGLTKSVVSILLLGVLAKNKNNVAVYEKEQFELKINALMLDRIIANPANFEIKKVVLQSPFFNRKINILEETKKLILKFRSFDKITLQTTNLTPTTLKFKNIVLNSKDPIQLFSRDLKNIFNNENEFLEAIRELENFYNKTINQLEKFVFETFKTNSLAELKARFEKIKTYINNKELLILGNNLNSIERLATFINQKRVPKDWADLDISNFKLKIKELSINFLIIETTVDSSNSKIEDSTQNLIDEILKLNRSQKNLLLRKVV